MRFYVLTAMCMKMVLFCDVALYGLGNNRRFTGAYRLRKIALMMKALSTSERQISTTQHPS
jgi:hypothetical protein